MMDALTHKLSIQLCNLELAEKLVAAGLKTPGAIRRASDTELLNIEGFGVRHVNAIRAKLGRL